jgi:hypothetical protein
MCGLLQGTAHWSHAAAGSVQGRRQRLLQVARANRLLRLFRLELQDFHGQSYLLQGPTGASVLVPDFSALWSAAEQLLGRTIDPLAIPWPAQDDAP